MRPSGASTSSSLNAAATRVLIPCTLALGVVFACSATDPVSSIELGVLQVRISSVSLPDSVGIGDTLIAHLSGRPGSGNRFSESHTVVERDTIHVMITVWATRGCGLAMDRHRHVVLLATATRECRHSGRAGSG